MGESDEKYYQGKSNHNQELSIDKTEIIKSAKHLGSEREAKTCFHA